MPDSDALTTLKSTISQYLRNPSAASSGTRATTYILQAGSARVVVMPVDWIDGQTLVKVVALVNKDGGPADELAKFLIAENMRLIFGKFSVEPTERMVFYEHTLLGDFLNRKELEIAVKAIASTADSTTMRSRPEFGGKKFGEL